MFKASVTFPAKRSFMAYLTAGCPSLMWLPSLVLAIGLVLRGRPSQAGILSGKIVDTTGAAVEGAYVLAYDDQLHVTNMATLPGKSVISQSDGSFLLNLTPGFYDVCIFSTGFTASCRKVLMSANDTNGYKVRLAVSPLVIKGRGDRFR